jgi:hypothetical protein
VEAQVIRALALVLLLSAQERRLPPAGVAVPEADRAELEKGLAELGRAMEPLKSNEFLPDVEIYHKAVRYALHHNEFFDAKEIPVAKRLLKQGLDRAVELRAGKPSWPTATGLVVRGYRSAIDGSAQPYGLVVPASFKPGTDRKHRLDVWLHGRDEKLSELKFIDQRQRSPGEFTPADTFVLHAYGRYCNAFKFAGEKDVFEALESAAKRYPISWSRLAVRGFSMGGAGCWHLAVHHAGLWTAAAPGAGFAETARYQRIDPETVPWYERKLWHWYDATDYAVNLFNSATVAYSGELDKQKQAADLMAEAMKAEGLELVHIIGPKTEHRYEPGAKAEVARRVDEAFKSVRDPVTLRVRFTTWTLRYNRMHEVTVDGLEKHWERARVEAKRVPGQGADEHVVEARTENVSAITLEPAYPAARVVLDGQELPGGKRFHKVEGKWRPGPAPEGLRKRHGLQGPIDDAFMGPFIVVRPTGKPAHEKAGAWATAEMDRSIKAWRSFFRGDARVTDDAKLTDEQIKQCNLVLWGDPSSNAVLKRIADRLPLMDRWSETRVPILIYPNPLNPERYVVVNSGFTFIDNMALSNARHVPMLPDWAVRDIETRKVVDAGFFGEPWDMIK